MRVNTNAPTTRATMTATSTRPVCGAGGHASREHGGNWWGGWGSNPRPGNYEIARVRRPCCAAAQRDFVDSAPVTSSTPSRRRSVSSALSPIDSSWRPSIALHRGAKTTPSTYKPGAVLDDLDDAEKATAMFDFQLDVGVVESPLGVSGEHPVDRRVRRGGRRCTDSICRSPCNRDLLGVGRRPRLGDARRRSATPGRPPAARRSLYRVTGAC